MKIAIATAAAFLAASSFAFAADNNGGKDGRNNDQTTTGSIKGNGLNKDGTGDDAQKCCEHSGGGAPCRENGTTMDQ